MAAKISWEACVSQRIVYNTPINTKRANQLVQMAKLRLQFWGQQDEEEFLSLKVEGYYDIIKELVLAHMSLNWLDCSNHICLVAYIREKLKYSKWTLINKLRKTRNAISYRGYYVDNDFFWREKSGLDDFINGMIERLS
jgi:hypothetical protein